MTFNPYSPPQSSLADVQGPLAPRPFSVWLLLLFLVVIAGSFAVGAARHIWFVVSHLTGAGIFTESAIPALVRVTIAAVLITTILSVFRRMQLGRWLGLLTLAGLAVLSVFGPMDVTRSNDGAIQVVRFVLFPFLFCWLAYAAGFSVKAQRYFSRLNTVT